MEPVAIVKSTIEELYTGLKNHIDHYAVNSHYDNVIVACLSHDFFEHSSEEDKNDPDFNFIKKVIAEVNSSRSKEIFDKHKDLTNVLPGAHFRFNHGNSYYSSEFDNQLRTSQFDRAVDLISKSHDDKAVMQVILPRMLQDEATSPIPAVLSVVLKPTEIKGKKYLDIIATYREQELSTWWLLNILELYSIQYKAIKKLDYKYLNGNLITVSLKSNWSKDIVPLGTKNDLDDETKKEDFRSMINAIYNFAALKQDRIAAGEKLTTALQSKKNNTATSSFDVSGLKSLNDELAVVRRSLDTADKNISLLSEFKTNREKMEEHFNEVISHLEKRNGYLNRTKNREDEKEWKTRAQTYFDEIIGDLNSAVSMLKGEVK